jgi:hypothetical protein
VSGAVSTLLRRPALDAGLGFLAGADGQETAKPRIKSGATGIFGAFVATLRQRAGGFSLPARHANVVQSLPLGPGSRLLVVEFGGRKLLVGQSRAGLNLLGDAE